MMKTAELEKYAAVWYNRKYGYVLRKMLTWRRVAAADSLRYICGSATFICMNDKSEFDEEPFKWYYFAFYFCKFIISGDIQFYILRGEKNALH